MVQDENGEETPFDERAAVNPSNAALLASRIQLSWRKHHAKRVASALDICVGMQVERVLENKWHPAVVSRVYSGGVVDIIYSGVTEATEELGVSLSFIRAAKNLTITQPDYVSSSNSWQSLWEPVDRRIDEIATADDIGLVAVPRQQLELRRTKSETDVLQWARNSASFLMDLRPLCSRCEHCNKLSIYRCHSCSVVFYCSRLCQRKSWPKHQVLCCPPSARYRYKEAFKPLFTDTSLAELSRRRQAVVARTVREAQSAGTITAFERSPAPSAPLMDEAVGTSSLFASPVRRQRESAKVHPETFGAESRNQNVRALSFTGASLGDIKKALEVHHNDVNAAANWLLMHDGYVAADEYSDMPSLASDTGATTNTVSWTQEAPMGPVKPSKEEQMWSWAGESSQLGWGQDVYNHGLEPSAPPIASPSSSLVNGHFDKGADSNDSTATIRSEDDEVVRVEILPDEDDSHLDAVALSLCEMLSGVSIETAKDALKSFKDPNEAAEWLMLHPGEKPSRRSVGTNGNPKHSQSRAPTPTLGSGYDDLD